MPSRHLYPRRPRRDREKYRVNERIRAHEVRVIGPDGKQYGIMRTSDALDLAYSMGLDLVEVAPHERPPVAKILDYGKLKYEEKVRKRRNRDGKKQASEPKEISVRPRIDEHDLQVKLKRMREFLEEGRKVKVKMMFRGREMKYVDKGEEVMKRIIDELSDISVVDVPIKREGRFMTMMLRSTVKKKG